MDDFQITILMEHLKLSPLEVTPDELSSALLQLPQEHVDEAYDLLVDPIRSPEEAKHIIELLKVLWTYK